MQSDELTALLRRWHGGDRSVEPQVMAAIYPALRAFAHRQLAGNAALTLQPTELAHEAYFQLAGQREIDWRNRAHFFSIAARIVRRVVIDYLRMRSAEKRGSGQMLVSIEHVQDADAPAADESFDWLHLDRVLDELDAVDREGARIVELRYFAGLSLEEAATAIGTSRASVVRQWRATRAWLHRRMSSLA